MERLPLAFQAWLGLVIAPLAWVLNMQLGLILPYADCRGSLRGSLVASTACALVALVSGLVSWQAGRLDEPNVRSASTTGFAIALSAMSALVFSFALILQMIASMVLSGCEH